MGREWYWSRPVTPRPEREAPGCMSGVLQFLDFHQLLFAAAEACTRPPPSSPARRRPSPQQIKAETNTSGLEAPRNSLDDGPQASAAASEDYYYDIPLGILLPTVADGKAKRAVFDEEKRDSHSHSQSLAATPRTPNVVARLMGLEILPDLAASPPIRTRRLPSKSVPATPVVAEPPGRYRRSKKLGDEGCKREPPPPRQPLQPRNTNVMRSVETGSRSLPDTPRPSSVRPWEADPRLSLQVNKENNHRAMQEFGYLCEDQYSVHSPQTMKPRRRDNVWTQEENKSPRSHYYAREIVKQVKDNISSRRGSAGGGEEDASRSRRNRQTDKKVLSEVMLPSSCSPPRTRFAEPPQPPPPKPLRPSPKVKENVEFKGVNMTASQCRKASCERYTEKIKKHSSAKKQSPIASSSVRPKPEATHQSSRPPPPAVQREIMNDALKVSSRSTQLPKERDSEFRYVRSILEYAGILTPAARAVRWYSPSLPVDPIIFHQLELQLPLFNDEAEGSLWTAEEHGLGPLRHRWNRKLLFHLVEEVLGDLLSGAANRLGGGGGEALLLRLWGRIRSFPAADCHVVGDIDALVEGDLQDAKIRGLLRDVAAEAEEIMVELERGILDSVVGEAAASLSLIGSSASFATWRRGPLGDQMTSH